MGKTRRGAFFHDAGMFGPIVGACAMIAVYLGGCSYFEKPTPQADNRIQLTAADGEIHIGRREARGYTCVGDLIFHCHDWSPKDLACGCIRP
jgi:hypothetical protein